jgi:hypothetical protein
MAGGLWSGLGKLVQAGAAYVQHVNFAHQALAMAPGDAMRQLQAYAQGLGEAGFAGLKVTLTMLLNQEQDAARKAGLQRLLAAADAARRGDAPPAAALQASASRSASFDEDLDLVAGWYDRLDGPQREHALFAHVGTLSPAGCREFTAHVQQMIDNIADRIQQHAQAENQAWGGSIEDRIAYGMARLQTGQRDPAWQRQMQTLQDVYGFFQAVLAATHHLGSERQRPQAMADEPPYTTERSSAMSNQGPKPGGKPDPKAALADVQAFMRTGQYPGGVEKMKADIAALVLAGEADEVMEALKAAGAIDAGNRPMVIEDHYVDGPEPYTLRWPIQFPLPMPFDKLPRKTQFSVLFGEWSRCEMEATYAMGEGRNDVARAGFDECLDRARQIAVPELVARSHEGLARLAAKLNDRALERQQLKAAIAARAGG